MNDITRWTEIAATTSLSRVQAKELMTLLISGDVAKEEIKTLLLALNKRPHEEDTIGGFAEGMLERATLVPIDRTPLIDTCGTGGDGLSTFNISTASAFVAAGAGVAVAKHGNRSVSSKSGSADVLEALGLKVDGNAEYVKSRIEKTGFGFFFAPVFHPAMKNVGPARRELGVRTVFNLLGPIANPARVDRQVVGIYDGALLETYARVLLSLGAKRILVVRGEDGMDEFSLTAPTRVCMADSEHGLKMETVTPEDVGLTRCSSEDLRGGDAKENARLMLDVLGGKEGPMLDATLFNAGAALVAAGVCADYKEGIAAARETVASGKALKVLNLLQESKGNPE
jgi:anthranilate phosphoribosyltransferase